MKPFLAIAGLTAVGAAIVYATRPTFVQRVSVSEALGSIGKSTAGGAAAGATAGSVVGGGVGLLGLVIDAVGELVTVPAGMAIGGAAGGVGGSVLGAGVGAVQWGTASAQWTRV